MKSAIPYIIIGILLTIIFLQWKNCSTPLPTEIVKIDTVVKIVEIREKIHGDTLYIISSKRDTVWKESVLYIPDSTYKGLLAQYYMLGDKFFATNSFKTSFPVKDYGYVEVTDSIRENVLVSSTLETFLKIPEKEIVIEKQITLPPMAELFIGGGLSGNTFVNGIQLGGMYKDRKSRMYGLNVQYHPSLGLSYGVSYYANIKKWK